MISIVNGVPKQMRLREVLQEFIEFRCSVVERRSRHDLKKAEERKEVVEGLLIAQKNVSIIVDILRDAR
jgi:DNA gyrase subunit A